MTPDPVTIYVDAGKSIGDFPHNTMTLPKRLFLVRPINFTALLAPKDYQKWRGT